ncbi:MAG: hypothetical protein IPI49_13375 [Myxococcales bacterium]|nr:hypothetical protein [Myxococcales bacterium]HRC55445.1 hypothetical protein [Kofleriaceae bacterium]
MASFTLISFVRLLSRGAITSLAALTLTSGCFDEPRPECGFACGTGDTCPPDYVCGGDKRCRLKSAPSAVCPGATADAGVDAP